MKGLSLLSVVLCGPLLLGGCGSTNDPPKPMGQAGATNNGGTANMGGSAGVGNAPTWHQDIAPIVTAHCSSCHRDGGIGPFSLQTYEQAYDWAGSLSGIVELGLMPPFLAAETDDCKPRFGFKDDLRVPADTSAKFKAWADAGAPEGDPATAAPLPTPVKLELDDAQVQAKIPSPVTVEGFEDKFICFSLAPDLTALAPSASDAALLGDRVLVDATQIKPGNAAIVHHVLVYTDTASESAPLAGDKGYYDCFGGPGLSSPALVMAWAPGTTPVQAPEGVAMAIPTTGRLVMQVHYHPLGQPQTDSDTTLQLRRYDAGLPEYIAELALMGNSRTTTNGGMGLQPGPGDGAEAEFRIPAGAENHIESMKLAIPASSPDYRLWLVGTHMHYVGTDMRIGITRPNPGSEPAEECLLQTPEWDFNWQRGYAYDVPIDQAPLAKAGDIINLRCSYDNSLNNGFVVGALKQQGLTEPRDVTLGEATLDEMCLGVFGIAQKVSDLRQ